MVSFLKKRTSKQESEQEEVILKKAKKKAESKNWYKDRHQLVVVQRNVLLVITFLSLIGLGISVIGVSVLTGSKILEPFVIQVEDKTGVVTRVSQKTVEQYTADDAVISSYIVKYVQSRMGYQPSTYLYEYYQYVRIFSSKDVYKDFTRYLNTSNPQSPLNLGTANRRVVAIKSISEIPNVPNSRQVRIRVQDMSMSDGDINRESHYLATVSYAFVDKPLKINERYVNPLGFFVTDWKLNRDQAK